MILEVAGTSTRNKGAELMLVAILEHFQGREDIELAVKWWFGTFHERARYGLQTKADDPRTLRTFIATAALPATLRKHFGLVRESEISAVLDASGFAFSDQLGAKRTVRFARELKRWKRQGKRVVLMPQALGPFQSPPVRAAFLEIVQLADLVYARDAISHQHLLDVAPAATNIRRAPDFTNLVEPIIPDGFEPSPRQVCIVPNSQMLKQTGAEDRARYLPFLAACLRVSDELGMSPYVLLHDNFADEALVEPLESVAGRSLTIVRERDPRKLKGILGTAHVVIGSRFHALVSTLSQGVPAVAAGWSHKYQELMDDYGCPELLLSTAANEDQIRTTLAGIVDGDGRRALIGRLRQASASIKEHVRVMWCEIDRTLGVETPPRLDASRSLSAPVEQVRA